MFSLTGIFLYKDRIYDHIFEREYTDKKKTGILGYFAL